MSNRALSSAAAAVACLNDHVLHLSGTELVTKAEAQHRLLKQFGYPTWSSLEAATRHVGVLINESTVCYSRPLQTTCEEAWRYISEPNQLERWHIPTTWDFREGGRFEFRDAWAGVIGEIVDGRSIRFDSDEYGATTFEVRPDGEYARVELTDCLPSDYVVPEHVKKTPVPLIASQPGGPGTHWSGVLAGWHSGADTLMHLTANKTAADNYNGLTLLYDLLLRRHHEAT